MAYGFCCGYCDTNLDTPHEGHDDAAKVAQAAGWRMTFGNTPRWGEGAHNTCPECIAPNEQTVPMHVERT